MAMSKPSDPLGKLAANFAAGEITWTGVDGRYAIVCVNVDVRAAVLDRRYQIAQRVAGERADQIGGRNCTLAEHAVMSAGARRNWPIQEGDDRAVHADRAKVYMCLDNIVNVGGYQLILERITILAQVKNSLPLRPAIYHYPDRRHLLAALQVRGEVTIRCKSGPNNSEQHDR